MLILLFLDKNNSVVKIFRRLKPWKITSLYFSLLTEKELIRNKTPITTSGANNI